MDTVTVSAAALRQVLQAFNGPPHMLLEITYTRGLPDNPADVLLEEYNAAVNAANIDSFKELPR